MKFLDKPVLEKSGVTVHCVRILRLRCEDMQIPRN